MTTTGRVALLAALLSCEPARARAEETCVQCHAQLRDPRLRAPVSELPSSVHGSKDVTCSDCHGGRPDEPTVKAHDATRGFRARAAAGDPELVCGGCHADPQRMHAGDATVPTDQLEQYVDSVHGRAFANGQRRAATCAACHGAHDVRKVSDPGARVHARNVARTCGGCHSDAELTASVRLPHDQEAQWRRSVHGQRHTAWITTRASGVPYAADERHPPTCNDCHKDHGIGPGDSAVAGCEGCHQAPFRSFQQGPHAQAFARMGFLPCVDCHGSHEIAEVSGGLIGVDHEASCLRCHAEGQEMFDDIRTLAVRVRAAEDAAGRAREAQQGVPIARVAARLRPVDDAQRALRSVVHTLDLEKISAAARELSARAAAVPAGTRAPSALLAEASERLPAALLLAAGLLALWVALWRRAGGKP